MRELRRVATAVGASARMEEGQWKSKTQLRREVSRCMRRPAVSVTQKRGRRELEAEVRARGGSPVSNGHFDEDGIRKRKRMTVGQMRVWLREA